MKHPVTIVISIIFICLIFSCKRDIPLETYFKIEKELNIPHPEMDMMRVETTVKKYGYTYDEYLRTYENLEKNPEKRDQAGKGSLE